MRMFVAVREIRKKRDDTNLVEGPDGYVNITEQKVKIITENFGNILKQDSVTVYLMSITEIKNTYWHYRDKVCHQDIERQQKPWMWQWSNIMIKCSPDIIYQCIADILNQVAETGEYPDDIRLGHLIPLPTPYKP